MIANLIGEITFIENSYIILNVGGVGFQVNCTKALCSQAHVGQNLCLFTYLVVREDLLALYGFESMEEKEVFLALLGVDGIGPKSALGVISTLSVDAIKRAVFNEQAEVFSRAPGVGLKSAQKILLHLKDRIKSSDTFDGLQHITDVDTEVLEALTALGYSVVEAQTALQRIPRDTPQDVETRLRMALQNFSK